MSAEEIKADHDDPRFAIWYGLWQIEQEAEAWMRARGLDDDLTLGFIKDKAQGCREEFEEMTR